MGKDFAKKAYRVFLVWGILSSLGITVSTFVDAVLIGNYVGSSGLAASSIATPVFLVYQLLGVTIGVGANIQIGRMLGADRVEEANQLFHIQAVLGGMCGVALMLLALLFRDRLCAFLGAAGILEPLVKQYLTVVFISAPIFVLYHIFAVTVRTDGEPRLAAYASAVVIVTNLSLDILFLKVLNWGIVGASASLCIAETLGTVLLVTHFFKKQALLHFGRTMPVMPSAVIGRLIGNGFGVGSAFVFQAIVMLLFNTLLLSGNTDGVIHVAVFGILYTMGTVSFAVFDGAGNAVSTVVSIFAGERDSDGILIVLWQGIKTVMAIGFLVSVVFYLTAEKAAVFFGTADSALPMAAHALRIYAVSILFAGVNTVLTAFWQAVGRAGLAGSMSVLRNFVFMLVFGGILIPEYRIAGVGLTYICSEALCLAGAVGVSAVSGPKGRIARMYPPASRVFEQYYTIREESVAQIGTDLVQLCEDWDIGASQAYFMNLIVEELLLNIIKFSLKDSAGSHYIDVKILDNAGEYIIRIRDNVNTYNPFDSGGDDIDAAVIKMIRTKTKCCNYQRKLIFNYLYLVI